MSRVLVVGLGNTIRGDDGVGLEAVKTLRAENRFSPADVQWRTLEESNVNILDFLEGAETLIVVDSVRTRDGRPGDIHRLYLEDIDCGTLRQSSHQMGLTKVLSMARELGLPLPRRVSIYAMETALTDDFTVGFSEEVKKRMADLQEAVRQGIKDNLVPLAV